MDGAYFLTAATTFFAASARSSAAMIGRFDSESSFFPAATLVPSSLTTSGTGSDRLIDAIIPHGPAVVAERVRQHLAAGADHVLLQPLGPDGKFAFDDLGPLAEALAGI